MATDTHFTIESWNHPCFNDKYYTMSWGPYPLANLRTIKETIVKNFDPRVKFVLYKHADINEQQLIERASRYSPLGVFYGPI